MYMYDKVYAFQTRGWPTSSVDAKKNEHVGNNANTGREDHKKGQPLEVNVYDVVDNTLDKAVLTISSAMRDS